MNWIIFIYFEYFYKFIIILFNRNNYNGQFKQQLRKSNNKILGFEAYKLLETSWGTASLWTWLIWQYKSTLIILFNFSHNWLSEALAVHRISK